MINIAVGFVEFFIPMQVFFGCVAFLLPAEAISGLTGIFNTDDNEAKPDKPFDNIGSSVTYPTYVTDDDGNNYTVSIDGDFLYINLPGGRISTKWEYIKGQPYFDLSGKRFYPHS